MAGSSYEERIKKIKQADAKPAFVRDEHDATGIPVKQSRIARRGKRIIFELPADQHSTLMSFRQVDISASAILRACITKLASDPGLLKEIQAMAGEEGDL